MVFKVGDFVIIRPDLTSGETYDGVYVNNTMARKAGQLVKLTGVGSYSVVSISDGYSWTREMFIPLDAEEMLKHYVNGKLTKQQYTKFLKEVEQHV